MTRQSLLVTIVLKQPEFALGLDKIIIARNNHKVALIIVVRIRALIQTLPQDSDVR